MNQDGPVFGKPELCEVYPERRGAYAVIAREGGSFAFVRGVSGRLFLPGGGIETGETSEIALERELAEEIGWRGRIVHSLGPASEYVVAMTGHRLFVKGTYFQVALTDRLTGDCEYQITWMPLAKAVGELARRCDAWAISQARS